MTKQELQYQILSKKYNRNKWQEVLKKVFGITKMHQQPIDILLTANEIADDAVELGSFYTKDERLVGVYEITIRPDASTDIANNRIGLRKLLKNIYQYDVDGALIVFVQGNKWRFSYVSEIRTEEGKKQTEPKRYTYLLGEGEICRTAAERFAKLIDKKYYLQDLYDAFSVEKLNKDFFNTYKEFYKKGVVHLVDKNEYYQLLYDKKAPDDDEEKRQKPIRDFVKKLLGRIVFLHFLQKKEWLGCTLYNASNFGEGWKDANENIWEDGSRSFMLELFKNFPNKEQFHSQCLSILFFETLNTKRENNIFNLSNLSNLSTKVRVPYLNGGLFESDSLDPITKQPLEAVIDFSSDFFDKLLDFFEQYNFTIDENDPYESEVGIDPEMLGHIFENLLEDNKDRGAFYTPKEIVHYMCQESLIEFFKTHRTKIKASNSTETIQAFEELVRNNRVAEILTDKANASIINSLLKNIKVCDPAIGSGAFPMGMLKEIFECRRIIYPYLKTNNDFTPSTVKKEIIQGNIYGVDVENGAVDIARLRFWLALVVDELIPSPLPNLDYKIMQGNSLLERYDIVDLKFERKVFATKLVKEVDLFGNIVNPQTTITEFLQTKQSSKEFDIIELEEKYFYSSNSQEKQAIRQKLENFEKEFIEEQLTAELDTLQKQLHLKENEFSTLLNAANTQKDKDKIGQSKKAKDIEKLKKDIEKIQYLQANLAEIKPNQKPYFLWHLYFMDVFNLGGFDIVIGNPPYIQLQSKSIDTTTLEKADYKTFTKTGDIYCLFYEQGFNLLKANGILTYITSNTWMRTKFGELVRKYFKDTTQPVALLNFEDTKIFQTATVETNIIISKNIPMQNPFNAVAIKADYALGTNILEYLNNNAIEINEPSDEGWIIADKNSFAIKKALEAGSLKLLDNGFEISRGIVTGLNEAFIIPNEKKNELISDNPNVTDILKKFIGGRNIHKYKIQWENEWLIYSNSSIKENDYPNIIKHLSNFKKKLEERRGGLNLKTGLVPYGWWQLQVDYYSSETYKNFEKPKIMWAELSDKAKFVYDTNCYYPNKTLYVITGEKLKSLLVILNSKAIAWYFDQISTTSGMGTTIWSKYKVEQLPIPQITDTTLQQKFEIIADYLIYLNDNTRLPVNSFTDNASIAPVFEDVANMMVYELYFTQHMKDLDIDVLQFVDTNKEFQPIDLSLNVDKGNNKKIICECYKWLQQQDNPIRNRIILSNIKSKNIIHRINATTH